MRDGYVARWRGEEYEASPDGEQVRLYAGRPLEGFAEVSADRFVRLVGEVDYLAYVCTLGVWRGQRVVVLAEHGDWMRVEYDGDAAAAPLERFERGVYQAWAPRDEVTGLHEVYT